MGELPIGDLPEGWRVVKLGDVCSKIGTGATPRGGGAVYVDKGTAFIRSQNVYDNEFSEDGLARIDDDAAEQLKGVEVHQGDVLLNITGDSILRTCCAPAHVLPARVSQHVAIIRPRGNLDSLFLQKYLTLPSVKEYMLGHSAGGTRKAITKGHIEGFLVPIPPIAEQRAIAGVLGALDDKIESNRRIVEICMEMSETTFIEWRGSLAAEETTTFGEFADVFGGATPSTSEPDYWGGDHVWVAPRDVTALDAVYLFDSVRHITDLGLARSSTTLHPPGSIFMTSRATIGAFAVNQVPCAPNQGFIVVRPRDPATRWFLFHEMLSRVVEMQDRATGSTFRELSRGSFREMTLSIPADDGSFIALDQAVAPVHARAAAAARESQSLTAIRDALLPELLSGRLRVREVEEMVGSV